MDNKESNNNLNLELHIGNKNFRTSIGLTDESQKIRYKNLLDFISFKNKIVFKSCFDHKGAKAFLREKNKALEEFILEDEVEIEDINEKKTYSQKKVIQKLHQKHYVNKKLHNYKRNNSKYNSEISSLAHLGHKNFNKKFMSSQNIFKESLKYTNLDKNKNANIRYDNRSKSGSSISNINRIDSGYLVTKGDNLLASIIINEMSGL